MATMIEGQHQSSNREGDADAIVAGLSSCQSVEAVASASENAAVAKPVVGGQTERDESSRIQFRRVASIEQTDIQAVGYRRFLAGAM